MATNKRKASIITNKDDIEYLLNISQKELESLSSMMNTFGIMNGKAPRFNTYDIFTVPAGAYGKGNVKNKKPFKTTVGRWWFNKCFIEQDLFDLFKYINKPITNDLLDKMNKTISYAIIEDKIPLDVLKRYLMRQQKYQPYANVLSSGFTDRMLTVQKILNRRKKELINKYKDDLADKDKCVYAADIIEKDLLALAKKELKDDISMDMYDSGAKGSFGNNFKNIFAMRGAIKNPNPSKGYSVVTSNYIDGISKDDYVAMAASSAPGAYARGRKTQLGGYWEKLFLRAFQYLKIGPKGSDCGTKRTITITLSKDVIDLMMYSYIVENGKLVELTSENRDKYLNKTVQMRFASLCEYKHNDQFCNVCLGNLFYRLGFENIGTALPQVASALKNKAMKAFHDSTVKLHEIDVEKAFGVKKK